MSSFATSPWESFSAPLAALTPAAVAVFVLLAVTLTGGELLLRRASQRAAPVAPASGRGQPTLTARRAQHLFERLSFVLAPAVVAGGITAVRHEHRAIGLFVFGSVIFATTVLWPGRSPTHLMPVARLFLRVTLPFVGLGLALLPGLVEPWELTPESAVPAFVAVALILPLAMWLESSFDSDRPVRLAVLGSADLARKLSAEMRQLRVRGYVVVGFIGPEPVAVPGPGIDSIAPWLGELDGIREIVRIIDVDLIAVGSDQPRLEVFEQTANACLDLPVRMIEVSAFYEEVLGHVPIGQINAAWFQCIMHPRYSPSSPLSKRVLDLIVAVPAALAAVPLLIVLALAVKLSDGGPALFRQRRVGEQGAEFNIAKLRTMRPDAAELVGRVPSEELVTPIGRVLRRSHLDELPQLFNVIGGDMTLVGPRPEQPWLVEELAGVVPYYERRALVKPGVTGWAQVRCGYAGTQAGTAWKICHDLYYIKRRSLAFDLLVILQTFDLFASGADRELEAPSEDFILGQPAGLVGR